MMGRIAWFAGLLVLAAVTIGLQLDRQSALNPALAGMVPAPLRAFAQTHVAVSASEGEDAAAALSEARRLIRRRPVPAEHLALLAVAQARADMTEQAGVTIQMAARRGWREPVSQQAMLRLALAAGDEAEAARRYVALLLLSDTPDELLQELGSQLFVTPEGAARQTMTEIVSGAERRHAMFLRRGVKVMPPDAFAEIVVTSAAQGASFPCMPLEQAAKALAQRDEDAASRKLTVAAENCAAS